MSDSLGPASVNYRRNKPTIESFAFSTVTEDEVSEAVDSLKCKTSLDCYHISTQMLKIVKFELINPLTTIFNQCINTGVFPDKLKTARVTAIYKKGEKFKFDNYRPISILPALSKTLDG